MFRVGVGYDVHRFAAEGDPRPLVLGGVAIPGMRGLAGHSDADVLTHAVCDAILGAAGLGDLGRLFPDTDPRWRGIPSLDLLRDVVALARRNGFHIVNVDAVLVAEEPKVAPLAGRIRAGLAALLRVDGERVSVKGKRPEGLGALGRQEGIACHAVALLGSRAGIRGLRALVRRSIGLW